MQDVCPGRPVHHGGLLDDAPTWDLVLDALTHPGGADRRRVPATACLRAFAPGVSAADAISGNLLLYSRAAQAFSAHDGVSQEPPLRDYATPAAAPE